jgi:hypothetical protein
MVSVHVLDNVVLPSKTVVDVAIDNNFTSFPWLLL